MAERKKGHSRSHADRNLGPARKRYRNRFFSGTLGRKAKKILAKRIGATA